MRGDAETLTASLAERGFTGFTIDAVVERSGVAKTTIYRHYPTKAALLSAVVACFGDREPAPHTGTVRTDLISLLTTLARALAEDEWARSLPSIIEAAEHNSELATLHAGLVRHKSAALREVLEQGIARHELRPDTDIDTAMASLAGPLFYRRLVLHENATPPLRVEARRRHPRRSGPPGTS